MAVSIWRAAGAVLVALVPAVSAGAESFCLRAGDVVYRDCVETIYDDSGARWIQCWDPGRQAPARPAPDRSWHRAAEGAADWCPGPADPAAPMALGRSDDD